MNVIELLFFVVLSAGLLAVGHLLSLKWGTAGLLVGFVPVGLFWSCVLLFVIRGTFFSVRYSLSSRPVCRRGKCKRANYVMVSSTPKKALFRCGCGDLYLSRGDRFLQLLPGNSLLPYMVRDGSGDWHPHTAEL